MTSQPRGGTHIITKSHEIPLLEYTLGPMAVEIRFSPNPRDADLFFFTLQKKITEKKVALRKKKVPLR